LVSARKKKTSLIEDRKVPLDKKEGKGKKKESPPRIASEEPGGKRKVSSLISSTGNRDAFRLREGKREEGGKGTPKDTSPEKRSWLYFRRLKEKRKIFFFSEGEGSGSATNEGEKQRLDYPLSARREREKEALRRLVRDAKGGGKEEKGGGRKPNPFGGKLRTKVTLPKMRPLGGGGLCEREKGYKLKGIRFLKKK